MRYRSSLRSLLVAIFFSTSLVWPAAASATDDSARTSTANEVEIPGPLRSFLRMAAVSQKAPAEEVLQQLARNVVVHGYEGPPEGVHRPTEYLILLKRYIEQARELAALAGPAGVIRVNNCGEAGPLLGILGYRLPQGCGGPSGTVETADRERAFVTIDSGFPLPALEETLHGGRPFEYRFGATRLPVLLTQEDWKGIGNYERKSASDTVVDVLVRDPGTARLYWSLSQMDPETRAQLRRAPGLRALSQHAGVLDFYGGQISIRSGRVQAPGGNAAEAGWRTLAGADPGNPSEFVLRLISKDSGWLAAYYDALAHATRAQQAYFTGEGRLQSFYEALRGKENSASATRSVLRPDGGLLLLATQLRLEANGQPVVPGNLETWRQILRRSKDSRVVKEQAAKSEWKTPDKLVQAMFALSRLNMPRGVEQTYLVLSEMDRRREGAQRLSPATVRLLADKFHVYGDQYPIFSEFHELDNGSIAQFIAVADSVDKIRNPLLRFNALGLLQANMGLWQILARQGEIPRSALNDSWHRLLNPFAGMHSLPQLYDAARSSLGELLRATGSRPELSQEEIIALLAGPRQPGPEAQRVRQEIAERMHSVLVRQRLISLDSLFALGEGLKDVAEGRTKVEALMPLVAELKEFEMPRTLFTNTERTEYAVGIPENRNSSIQMRTDLTKVLKAEASPSSVVNGRGQLVPFLRDTLVGLNYAYYEPPGAQMLHNNPLFVRSHDFTGSFGEEQHAWQTPQLLGAGIAAGRGAHLMGSLADLPYVLAQVEQDFIVPENVQALIWDEAAPTLMTSSVLPRWWGVTRNEMHAVALYQRGGEELLEAAAKDETLRREVMAIFAERMSPRRAEKIEKALSAGRVEEMMPEILPAETFYLTAEFRKRHPGQTDGLGEAGKELEALSEKYPEETSWAKLSAEFGVPHPAMARNYSLELARGKMLPSLAGYGSRLLAESWDSNNLYWARLADEMGYAPASLNELVPRATLRMVEKIFASNLDDWPALLRAMREAGEELRQSRNAVAASSGAGSSVGGESTPR